MDTQHHKETLSTDVIIVGGGMVGMTLALALAREGVEVVLIDRETPHSKAQTEHDGRVSAIAVGSMRILKALGVWPHMEKDAEAITDIRVSDNNSPFFLHYQYQEVGEGPFGWIV